MGAKWGLLLFGCARVASMHGMDEVSLASATLCCSTFVWLWIVDYCRSVVSIHPGRKHGCWHKLELVYMLCMPVLVYTCRGTRPALSLISVLSIHVHICLYVDCVTKKMMQCTIPASGTIAADCAAQPHCAGQLVMGSWASML